MVAAAGEVRMLYNVQFLRAVAAGVVIFVHLAALLSPAGFRPEDLAFGQVGVDLFFVISGFIMVHTIKRKPMSAGNFLINRFIRVVPLYWLLTLAVFAIALVAPSLPGTARALPLELAKSLLFVPFAKPNGQIAPMLFVGWTLNYEMFFYLIFALGIYASRRSLAGTVTFTAIVLLALVAAGAAWQPASVPLHFFSSPLMLEFAFGMALGWSEIGRRAVPARVAMTIVVAGMILLVMTPFIETGLPRLLTAGLPSMIVLWAALAAEARGLAIRQPAVQLAGAASYALYLTHPFPLQAFGKISQRIGSAPVAYALAALAIAIAVIVAILVHKLIEVRMTDAMRRLVGHELPVVERLEPKLATGGPL